MGFSTECIHAGQEPEAITGSVTYPIFQTSTYVQPKLGEHKGFEYARTGNPTRSVLEANLAALEHGKYGHCFASGMSSIDVVFRMLQSGDHVVAGENLYGGSYRLFSKVLEKFGLLFTYVDTSNLDAVRKAVTSKTKVLFLETPTNPMMTLTDLAACSEIAHAAGALVVVDNTFCSPYLQRPIDLGADIVLHSTDGKISLKSGNTPTTGSDVLIQGADVKIKAGATVVIEATTAITLKVGGSLVNISASGVDIVGPLVKVNSGGGGGSASPALAASPVAPTDAKKEDTTTPEKKIDYKKNFDDPMAADPPPPA